MTRERVSRPTWSVPNRACASGGLFIRRKFVLSGSAGAIQGAAIAIAITRLPFGGRVIRSVAITVREMAYVEAGRASGASAFRIMRLHVLPQCVAPYLVLATTHLGVAIVIEAALGFLGVGVPPPTATWGNMLADSITGLVPRWWLVLFPGLAITITVLAFNLLGDGIRDTLDPRLSPGFLRLVTGSGRGTAAATPTRAASLQEDRSGA